MFWDIEVSPLLVTTWRIGNDIRLTYENIVKERSIISVSWKWEGGKTQSLTWDKNQNDKKLLQEFVPILNSADESVAHFGDNFDLKWVKARALYHRIPTLPSYHTTDTCKLASKFYFCSRKLDYLAKFLGVGQKIRTEDGLWRRVVLDKCEKSLRFMEKYNRADVELLEQVWQILQHVSPHKTHAAVVNGGERWQCPRCESEKVYLNKTRVTAAGTKQYQMACRSCGGYHSVSGTVHEQYLASKLPNLRPRNP